MTEGKKPTLGALRQAILSTIQSLQSEGAREENILRHLVEQGWPVTEAESNPGNAPFYQALMGLRDDMCISPVGRERGYELTERGRLELGGADEGS
jgi:hypothetical protein